MADMLLRAEKHMRFWRNSFIVFSVLFIVANIAWQLPNDDPRKDAYERGWQDATARYIVDTIIDTLPMAPNEAPWAWLDTHIVIRFDSTDTMPAVEDGQAASWLRRFVAQWGS